MPPTWMIEELERERRERSRNEERPRVWTELPAPQPGSDPSPDDAEDVPRGVWTIDVL